MWTDKQKVKIAIKLLEQGLIDKTDFDSLGYNIETLEIIGDIHFPVDICENGDVYIWKYDPYPIIIKRYVQKNCKLN